MNEAEPVWADGSEPARPVGLRPEAADDGAADRLIGRAMPIARLRATTGSDVDLSDLPMGRTVVFVYPRTARPGRPMPPGWDEVAGAQGCTAELCGIREHGAELRESGAVAIFGLSTQDAAYQREAALRLHLDYPLLADPTRQVGRSLGLPTFTVSGTTVYRRLTLVVQDGVIEHVFHPVTAPESHAADVARWLTARRRPTSSRAPSRPAPAGPTA